MYANIRAEQSFYTFCNKIPVSIFEPVPVPGMCIQGIERIYCAVSKTYCTPIN